MPAVQVAQDDDLADLERARRGDQTVRHVEVLVLVEHTRAGRYINEIHLVPPLGHLRPGAHPHGTGRLLVNTPARRGFNHGRGRGLDQGGWIRPR
ncbi:hypothetical protein GCM10009812_00220 [Nocardioides marinus]